MADGVSEPAHILRVFSTEFSSILGQQGVDKRKEITILSELRKAPARKGPQSRFVTLEWQKEIADEIVGRVASRRARCLGA